MWRLSPFEQRLSAARRRGDLALCLSLLRAADFAMPISEAAATGDEPVAWPTRPDPERTWLIAYTSEEALRTGTGGAVAHHRIVLMVELAAGWPDPRWGLAVNPGLEPSFLLESGTVARLAVPTLAQDHAAEPGVPIVQKLLRPAQIQELLDGGSWVSGYCHHALDVAHIATPSVLAEALLQEDAITDRGAVNILRWPAIGFDLYRTPYGGVDEEGMRAVAGWVVEEPPFVGMGLVPNVDQTIREYKVAGVPLPHGAEIVELGADGVTRLRAVYDGDRGWRLVPGAAE
ncbi:SseB family protein [Planomonospora sp. ID82291]|uniref:SseB family protein n=1 Tax=Planomonospora sp. ID82291 TaxID=2738136 RepID=UPI0018C3FE0B|nr:SseB family protein [Planomonospora sp. ID82291]MBG0816643.1 SseB family protein [Planomonospora sp. ID82291]